MYKDSHHIALFVGSITKRIGLLLVLGVLLCGASAFAAFLEPGTPPAGNVNPVIDTGPANQAKDGAFSANYIQGTSFSFGGSQNAKWYTDPNDSKLTIKTDQYCLNGSCITSWNTGGGSPDCHLERKVISAIPSSSNYADICDYELAASSANAGWVAAGSDACSDSGSDNCDHGDPALQCYYVRIVCN